MKNNSNDPRNDDMMTVLRLIRKNDFTLDEIRAAYEETQVRLLKDFKEKPTMKVRIVGLGTM